MFIGIISIVLVLGGLIFFHELGHFLLARLLGIGVKTFSIGFGPALLTWKGKKTKYQISVFPLGGFVSMVGESDAADIPPPFTKEESFALRAPLHRLLVVISGPLFNLLLAFFIFWGLFIGAGSYPLPELGEILPQSPAQTAGLQTGDLVKSVDGKETWNWPKLYSAIQESEGREMTREIERNGQPLAFRLSAELYRGEDENGLVFENWRIGIASSGRNQAIGIAEAARLGLDETWRLTALIGHFVKRIFSGQGSVDEIGGPVLVAKLVHDQANQGPRQLLYLTAFLSINLGLLNLLPIPALDGGHVLFCAIELIFRRPLPARIQTIFIYAGFILLITLMLLATAFDIFRIVQ